MKWDEFRIGMKWEIDNWNEMGKLTRNEMGWIQDWNEMGN